MKVSVVIPVYRAAAYVEQAVASALAQPETGEVLLVEDGSPDGSLAACEKLAAANAAVRLLRHPNGENRGAGASRNLGIEQAACPLVAFLDADDFYLPGRFAGAVSILAAQPEVDGVYDDVEMFAEDDDAHRRGEESGWPDRAGVRGAVAPEDLFEAMVTGGAGVFHTDGIVVRRELFEKSGVFDPRFRTAQDTHLWIRMAATGRLVPGTPGFVAARCRIHAGNRVTGRPRRDQVEGVRRVWADLVRWGNRQGLPPRWIQRLARRYVSASRGIVLSQSILRAWGTAAQTLALVLLRCPQPWRVEGVRDLLGEASGLGLAMQRAGDRLVYGRPRTVPEGLPSLALVIVWFGPWPFWMRAFLLSCRHNPTVDWLIFSDSEPPAGLPGNVKILPLGLDAFNRRATQALGFEVKVLPTYAYKMCDLKILYGRIFAEELAGVDFWGCCDMDIVWGDLRRFLTPERLARYDVITSRPGRIAGHFCLFRNRPEWTDLFRRIPDVAGRAGDSGAYRRIDEDGLTDLLQGYQRSLLIRLWTAVVRRRAVPRVYWEQEWTTRGRHQREMLADAGLTMRWRDGRTFGVHGEEMMYLHFHEIRKEMRGLEWPAGGAPREIEITPRGLVARGAENAGDAVVGSPGKG
jgi:glycosyltransferase involved in cell wall biosynthesis